MPETPSPIRVISWRRVALLPVVWCCLVLYHYVAVSNGALNFTAGDTDTSVSNASLFPIRHRPPAPFPFLLQAGVQPLKWLVYPNNSVGATRAAWLAPYFGVLTDPYSVTAWYARFAAVNATLWCAGAIALLAAYGRIGQHTSA